MIPLVSVLEECAATAHWSNQLKVRVWVKLTAPYLIAGISKRLAPQNEQSHTNKIA